jgi:repressor LexA
MEYLDLTSRQAAILDFIKSEIREKGYPPTVREIGEVVGLLSPSTVHGHLTVLEKKGYIRRDASKPRALEVMDSPTLANREMVELPILGRISAGQPAFAEENFEDTFPLAFDFIQSNNQLFMLRVRGESMIEAGIYDGDLLIVEQTSDARDGQIVVALIDDEATVKTFYRMGNMIRLQPENSALEPIIVPEANILGRAIGLFRRF